MTEPGLQMDAIDPEQFARTVAETPDEQLAAGMASEHREAILDEIFGRVGAHVDPERAKGVEAVIRFRITGRSDGEADRYEVTLHDGQASVSRELGEDPRVTLTIDAVDFLKLVSGNAAGPELFMRGKLAVKGDLMFAAQAAGLFTLPKAG